MLGNARGNDLKEKKAKAFAWFSRTLFASSVDVCGG